MAGNRPLVPIAEPVAPAAGVVAQMRAQNDATFTRYELMSAPGGAPAYWWRAFATDGTTYFFGDTAPGYPNGCTFTDEYAPLTRTIDSFGNQVSYHYALGFANECRISSITWGANATLADFASVTFSYNTAAQQLGTCTNATAPIGAQVSYRTGTPIVTGASQLDSITVTAYPPGSPGSPVHTRLATLQYDADAGSCNAPHAAYRALTSIQESAWGTDSPRVDLPAVTFTYGSATLSWPTATQMTLPWTAAEHGDSRAGYNLGWGYRFNTGRWPSVEAMFIDVDGDGLVDRVVNDSQTINGVWLCGAAWEKNLGGFTFAAKQHIPLPTLKWQSPGSYNGGGGPIGEQGCALNYQLTTYTNQFAATGCGANNGTCSPYCTNGTDCKCVVHRS